MMVIKWKSRLRGGWLALTALILDRLSKRLASSILRPIDLLGLFRLECARNSGISFSLLSGQPTLLCLLTGIGIMCILVWILRKPDEKPLFRAGLWLIAGGGLGNFIDRILYGAVIDFIEPLFIRFAVFNVADICVCAGAILVLISAFGKEETYGTTVSRTGRDRRSP